MEPVAEAMVGLVVSLAAASYGHFGVTLKAAPALHPAHSKTSHAVVQRLPASAVNPVRPCTQTVAERTVLIRRV
jgi:hypothetical protein